MDLFSYFDLPGLIAAYGCMAVFVIILMESAGVPLPGETALISAAVYAGTTHRLDIGLVVAAAAAGAIIGDNLGYWVGRRYGFPLLLRYGRYVGLTEGRLKLGEYLFRRHGPKIVFFGRFTALLRTFAAVLAGANRYPSRQFFLYNAAGGMAWSALVGFGGYLCGTAIENIMGPIGCTLLAFLVASSIALWLLFRRHEARLMIEAEAAFPGPLSARLGELGAGPRLVLKEPAV